MKSERLQPAATLFRFLKAEVKIASRISDGGQIIVKRKCISSVVDA